MQTQSSKNSSHFKVFKSKDPKPAPPYDNMAEPTIKEGEKKKKSREQRQECTKDRKKQFPATDVNTKASKKKIRARCFNCNKKSHYANDCTKLSKN